MGDPAGIGPESILQALSLKETFEKCNPIVTGDAAVMEYVARQQGSRLCIHAVKDVDEALFEPGTVDVFDLNLIDMSTFEQGKVAVQCGNAAFQSVILTDIRRFMRISHIPRSMPCSWRTSF